MKIVIVQKWPVWLKKTFVDAHFSHMQQLKIENDDSFIPENCIQCLPDDYPNDIDFASKTLAITSLKNILEKIEKNTEIIAFMNGINIDGTVSPNDYVYKNENIQIDQLCKRNDIIIMLNDSKYSKQTEEEPEIEFKYEETVESEDESAPNIVNNGDNDVNKIIMRRRDSMNENEDSEEEPKWLQEAEYEQRATTIAYPENSESLETEKIDENKNIVELEENSDYYENVETKKTNSNTFVISDSHVVLELKGVLLPSVLCALAPQRVIVPLENGNVVMISGTKKIVRIAQWTIDINSFNEATYTYNSTDSKSNIRSGYDLRSSNVKTSLQKNKSISVNKRQNIKKGTIKTLHSLKKLQYQRR